MTQSIIRKWRKRARRIMFFSGMACTLLFLGFSFVRPHILTIIDLALVPCILYGVFVGYRYYQFKREIKGKEEGEL